MQQKPSVRPFTPCATTGKTTALAKRYLQSSGFNVLIFNKELRDVVDFEVESVSFE